MIICHVCNAECEEGTELCPVCGANLNTAPEKETTEELVMTDPTMLTSFEDMISAEIFKDILKDNRILFTSSADMGEALQVTFGGGLVTEDIYVDESDFEKANELLEQFLSSADFQELDFEDEQ